MRYIIGLGGAFAIFAFCFALHIVGGATDQGWLFAIAVVLIYLSASGYPAIAWILAGHPEGDRLLTGLGAVIGIVLTVSALRAANDRTFVWWQVPLGIAAVAVTSAVIVVATVWWRRARGGPLPATH